MLEVEVKYRARLGEARERVLALGFFPRGVSEEVDTYFQHPCRDFAATDEALRVRVAGGTAVLTYKGPRVGAGAKTRVEVTASAEPTVVEVLERLGFVKVAAIKKRREYYEGLGVLVSLDEVEGLGEFVEIEKVVAREEDIPSAVEELSRIASLLGLVEEVKETYLELALKRAANSKISLT